MSKLNVVKSITLIMVVAMLAVIAAQCGAAPEPETVTVVETVVVTQEVEGETVTVVETVEVEKEVVVEKEVPVEQEVVTIAYNGYFDKTFGPADTPINVLREEVAKKYPNIKVELNIMPYEASPWRDNYLAWFQAEDGTTDLIGMGLYWMPEFGQAEWLMPLNDLVSPEIMDGLNPAYVDAFTYNGDVPGPGSVVGAALAVYITARTCWKKTVLSHLKPTLSW